VDGFRSIVVHIDAAARSEARLRIAQALARACGAQLTGLYAVTSAAYGLAPTAGAVYAPPFERIERESGERAQAMFGSIAPQARWQEAGPAPAYRALAARALTTDLVVFGQHDVMEPLTALDSDLVASTLIESGTPGLVVPHSGAFAPEPFAGAPLTVLLAWKPAREAARAARAALPWLRTARQVHIAVPSVAEESLLSPGADQLRAWLALNGVTATARVHALGNANPGELLLSMAVDVSADLLVMGCFGHSRARELILGGASRTVLTSMTLPVLMAH
jgi:nucleotide-binding universal stress UspA family protein